MPVLFLDIETSGLNPLISELVTLQLMTSSGKSIIIKATESLVVLKSQLERSLVVGHNIKFDSKFLKSQYGITLYSVYDTYLAEIAISGGKLARRKGASLADLVFKYCGVTLDKSEQLGFKKGEPLTPEQEKYALNDLKYLPEIMKQQQAQIAFLGLENIIDIEMKCIPAVVWLELSGFHVDLEKLEEIKVSVQEQYEKARVFLQQELIIFDKQSQLDGSFIPRELNLSSPEQLKIALQNKGYGIDKTDKKTRAKYTHDPIFQNLADFKESETLLKMFIKPLPEFINSNTNRVYSDFWQYGAKSGRFTCGKPNLQQQPSKFKEWRTIFTAEPGNKLIVADLSQIELRIIGQKARDKNYIHAYNEGLDLHRNTAAVMFKVPVDQITKQQRGTAKSVNFGLNYGMGKRSLKEKLKLETGIDYTENEVAKFIEDFKNLYPDVTNYLKTISQKGFNRLEVRTEAGRLFKFDKPSAESVEKYNVQKGNIERECKNLPVQGLCADMLKIAMGNLFLILEPRGVKLVNCVHDELVFECKAEEAEEVAAIVKTEMEKAGELFLKDLPCIAEVKVSDTWEK
jgi:DNA polymerase I-like protein with 3'-5' exonuclease and polymerase domains